MTVDDTFLAPPVPPEPALPSPSAAGTKPARGNAPAPARAALASAVDRLFAEPHNFHFHQAVRLLDRWVRQQGPGQRTELRFRNSLSLSFPASEIAALKVHDRIAANDEAADAAEAAYAAVKAAAAGDAETALGIDLAPKRPADEARPPERVDLTPAFMGLLGSTGTLPLSYTEQFLSREIYQRDDAARAFLDIFQHRAVSLFHAAWRKHRLPLQYETDPRAHFRPLALSFAGLGMNGLLDRLQATRGAVADDVIAYYAGSFQQRIVGARQLQGLLADYFGIPVKLEQFVGRWFTLDEDNRSHLGMANATLGSDVMVGERAWQRDLRVRLTIGPMTRQQQARFLPGGPGAVALEEMVTLATGSSLEYEVRLSLLASAVTPAKLSDPTDAEGARLGWNSFLLSQPSATDREEAAYDIHAAA